MSIMSLCFRVFLLVFVLTQAGVATAQMWLGCPGLRTLDGSDSTLHLQGVTLGCLDDIHALCTGFPSIECNSAVSRFCHDQVVDPDAWSFVSGFGPLPTPPGSLDDHQVACVTDKAAVIPAEVPFSTLAGLDASCADVADAQAGDCSHAIHEHCMDLGHASGFGPIGNAMVGADGGLHPVADGQFAVDYDRNLFGRAYR